MRIQHSKNKKNIPNNKFYASYTKGYLLYQLNSIQDQLSHCQEFYFLEVTQRYCNAYGLADNFTVLELKQHRLEIRQKKVLRSLMKHINLFVFSSMDDDMLIQTCLGRKSITAHLALKSPVKAVNDRMSLQILIITRRIWTELTIESVGLAYFLVVPHSMFI